MQAPFDIPADLDTPVSAYLKLGPLSPRFLLESVAGPEHAARYSFLGFGDALELVLDKAELRVGAQRFPAPRNRAELLERLRAALSQAPALAPDSLPVPFRGGLVGVLGYDLAHRLERVPAPRASGEPELHLIAPRGTLVFDHYRLTASLLSSGDEAERSALRCEVRRLLAGPLPKRRTGGSFEPPRARLDERSFAERVRLAQEAIRDGEVYQLVLSSRFTGACDLSPLEVYRALRLLNPSPYMYFFELENLAIAGASPEALVRLDAGRARLQPIAGTRARGQDELEDRALEHELLCDPKEAAEHVMLVDLARNDLGRVAIPGSVIVDPYRSVERYSHVMHLVSGVSGEIEEPADAFDLFAACFPGGTVVGAPKVRAMQLIDELEPEPRGLYAGTAGYFDRGGSMDQALLIRTLFFQDGSYRFQAGAGIVADSRPEAEFAEMTAKSAALRAALVLAAEGLP